MVLYVLSAFVVVTFVSNTALIHLLEDENRPVSGSSGHGVVNPSHARLATLMGLDKKMTKASPINSKNDNKQPRPRVPPSAAPPFGTCSILLFGLPRAFRQYVLPSLVENVIRPNIRYGCDYFVHYYHIDKEVSNGRSGRGGMIHPDDIRLLSKAVAETFNNGTSEQPHASNPPRVFIISDTNETFWEKRRPQLMKYRNTRNANGNLTYFPYTEPTYVYPDTIDNIVKQWHSIDAVWNLMEQEQHQQSAKKYQQVAMIRSDVVYITPVDIYAIPSGGVDKGTIFSASSSYTRSSNLVIIPDFAKWPINDRMIIGPFEAVKLWATERFLRIDHYATKVAAPGTAMHSETFLNDTILTSIRSDLHLPIYEDPWLCFLRVRADGAIWIEDCDAAKSGSGGGFPGKVLPYLMQFLNQPNATCRQRWLQDPVRRIKELVCKQGHMTSDALAAARENMLQKRLRAKQPTA
jgi:hypothetical protein